MYCPNCKEKLDNLLLQGVEIDYCRNCQGMFFDQDELRLAKDAKDEQLKWLDIELWQDEKLLELARDSAKNCPSCRLPMYELSYGQKEAAGVLPRVKIDTCRVCHGLWLYRGEVN